MRLVDDQQLRGGAFTAREGLDRRDLDGLGGAGVSAEDDAAGHAEGAEARGGLRDELAAVGDEQRRAVGAADQFGGDLGLSGASREGEDDGAMGRERGFDVGDGLELIGAECQACSTAGNVFPRTSIRFCTKIGLTAASTINACDANSSAPRLVGKNFVIG